MPRGHRPTRSWLNRAATLHEVFERVADEFPDRPALAWAGTTISYRELNQQANAVAHRLRREGVDEEARVVLLASRSPAAIVGMLAVSKAAGAFLPLDPTYPDGLLGQTIRESGAVVVLDGSGAVGGPEPLDVGSISRLALGSAGAGESATNPGIPTLPSQVVYVIHTSGTTGRPKRVAVEHRNLLHYLANATTRLHLEPGLHHAWVSGAAADLGLTVVFGALLTGGVLHPVPEDTVTDAEQFAEYARQHRIDILKATPSHVDALLAATDRAAVLPRRCLVLGGEVLPAALWIRIRTLAPDLMVVNHYGPAETTVGVCTAEVDGVDGPTVPIGTTWPGVCLHVLNDALQPVPPGHDGELYVGGAQVTRGYLGQPGLTAERFLPDPFDRGGRLYRTGDRCRRREDGGLDFLGRRDRQVKIRGYRVEPEMVEAALRAHPDVEAVVCLSRPRGDGTTELLSVARVPERRAGIVRGIPRQPLPNGLAVVSGNPAETRYAYEEIFGRQAYHRHGIRLNNLHTVVDVGANVGIFTLFVGLHNPGVRVVAVEPNPQTHQFLQINARLYGVNATVWPVAISDRDGTAMYTRYLNAPLLSGLDVDPATERDLIVRYLANLGITGPREDTASLVEQRLATERLPVPTRTLGRGQDSSEAPLPRPEPSHRRSCAHLRGRRSRLGERSAQRPDQRGQGR